jgi:hypothetical protein
MSEFDQQVQVYMGVTVLTSRDGGRQVKWRLWKT